MAQPSRILYSINALAAGGTERQLFYLLRNLDRNRFAPHVVSIYGKSSMVRHWVDELKALDIPLYTLSHMDSWRAPITDIWRYVQLMWQLRPHIVHGCLHYANLISRGARPFCPPHRLITSVRGLYSPTELRWERRTAWLSDRVVTNSAYIANHLIEGARLSPNRISVIANAIQLDMFTQNSHPSLRHELFPDATFVAIMVARIDPLKDHATLLEALYRLRDNLPAGFRLLLVGQISVGASQKQIEALIARYNLSKYVLQKSPVDDVVTYYYAADISLLTSNSESFPNVILESFAAGRPVIASRAANTANIVEPGITGWQFPTGDAAALAQCLQEAWQMPRHELAKMGDTARGEAAKYSVSTMVESYTRLYDSLLNINLLRS
jgi:glycosyltransferase involved in cell wall biosynthesis